MAYSLNVEGKKIDKQKCFVLTVTRIGIMFPMAVRHSDQRLTCRTTLVCGYICEEKQCIYIGDTNVASGGSKWLTLKDNRGFLCTTDRV
jgi:hypothetical protein